MAGASPAASQGALPPLGAPLRPPLHGPERRAPAGGAAGTLSDADSLPHARWDPGRTSRLGTNRHTERRTPHTTNWGLSLRTRVTPTPTPAGRLWMDEYLAPAPEINLPLDGTDSAGATTVPTLSPSPRLREGR